MVTERNRLIEAANHLDVLAGDGPSMFYGFLSDSLRGTARIHYPIGRLCAGCTDPMPCPSVVTWTDLSNVILGWH